MIHVLIPSWNNAEWINRCLWSVQNQTHKPNVLVIDDASTDGSWEILAPMCQTFGFDYYRNDYNLKCPRNLWEGIKRINPDPEDVIYLLDGDDFLPHSNVMSRVEEIFSDPYIWLTYGNYDAHPTNTGQVPASNFPPDITARRFFRPWARQLFNHPLIFRAHLWNALEESDLKKPNGEWYDIGYDKLIMLPMLEMSTPFYHQRPHWLFVDEVLYTYNSVNPLSDVHKPNAFSACDEVWKRPVKDPHEWISQ